MYFNIQQSHNGYNFSIEHNGFSQHGKAKSRKEALRIIFGIIRRLAK